MTLDAYTASCSTLPFDLGKRSSHVRWSRDVRSLDSLLNQIRSGLMQHESLAQAADIRLQPLERLGEEVWLQVQADEVHFAAIPGVREPLAWHGGDRVAASLTMPHGVDERADRAERWVLVGPLGRPPVLWHRVATELAQRQHLARHIGSSLATLHAQHVNFMAPQEQNLAFFATRLQPDFQVTARAHPDIAAVIEAVVKEITGLSLGLTLGQPATDIMLLSGESPVWLGLDTAHRGDPAVDVSTLLADLLVRACAAPEGPEAFVEAAAAFWQGYVSVAGPDFGHSGMLQGSLEARVCRQIGVLMLAALDGERASKVPIPAIGESSVRSIGRSLLMRPFGRLDGVFTRTLQSRRSA